MRVAFSSSNQQPSLIDDTEDCNSNAALGIESTVESDESKIVPENFDISTTNMPSLMPTPMLVDEVPPINQSDNFTHLSTIPDNQHHVTDISLTRSISHNIMAPPPSISERLACSLTVQQPDFTRSLTSHPACEDATAKIDSFQPLNTIVEPKRRVGLTESLETNVSIDKIESPSLPPLPSLHPHLPPSNNHPDPSLPPQLDADALNKFRFLSSLTTASSSSTADSGPGQFNSVFNSTVFPSSSRNLWKLLSTTNSDLSHPSSSKVEPTIVNSLDPWPASKPPPESDQSSLKPPFQIMPKTCSCVDIMSSPTTIVASSSVKLKRRFNVEPLQFNRSEIVGGTLQLATTTTSSHPNEATPNLLNFFPYDEDTPPIEPEILNFLQHYQRNSPSNAPRTSIIDQSNVLNTPACTTNFASALNSSISSYSRLLSCLSPLPLFKADPSNNETTIQSLLGLGPSDAIKVKPSPTSENTGKVERNNSVVDGASNEARSSIESIGNEMRDGDDDAGGSTKRTEN